MPPFPARTTRAVAAAVVLLACAEGGSPTQPRSTSGRPAVTPRALADVGPAPAGLPSTIHACYMPGKGMIYRIDVDGAPDECAANDIEFSWSDQGIPGPQGATGPQGPQGEQGPQGPAGAGPMTGLTFHSQAVTLPADGRVILDCQAGKSVVNSGWEIPINSTAQASQIKGVRPAISGTQVRWGFHAAPGTLYVLYWTCADAEPYTLAQ